MATQCKPIAALPAQNSFMKYLVVAMLLLCLAGLQACQSDGFAVSSNPEGAAAAAHSGVQRFTVDVGDNTGLSDLTIDNAGHFWAVPERQRVLLRLNLTRDNPGLDDAPIPLDGVPEGLDTESLAWLSDGHFAVGTETQVKGRLSDDILMVSVEGGRAKVQSRLQLPYRLWHMRGRANDGIEGLCYAAGQILASVETTDVTADGKRFAPIGRYDFKTATWTPFSLLLTSRIGKISGMACRAAKGASDIEVLAIERHFGISHLLRFVIPLHGEGAVIKPEIYVDFGKIVDAVPNLEGVAWSPEGDTYLLSDNDFGIVTGPTQAIMIPRDWR